VPASVRFSPAFQAEHLGASQWPAAVGADPYQEPIELFERYMGTLPWDDGDLKDAAELGHVLEDFVAKVAARELGVETRPCATLQHPTMPWAIATPDRVLDDGSSLQVKTSGLLTRGAFIEEWGDPGTDEVPTRVLVQVMGEMKILRDWTAAYLPDLPRCTHTHVAAFVGQRGILLYRVEWDEELAQLLLDQVRAFWTGVITKKPPRDDASEAFTSYLGRRHPTHEKGKWLDANGAATRDALSLRRHLALVEKHDAKVTAAKNRLCARIGDAEGIKGPWGSVAWRAVSGRTSLKIEPLLADLRGRFGAEPVNALIEQHTKQGSGHRAFRPTWTKEETK
jgi:predicted phage-related endonuclease